MRFDDFSESARRVVETANALAKKKGHPHLTAEHLLLTMLDTRDTHAQNIWSYLGTQTATLHKALTDELKNLPSVEGQDSVYIAPQLVRVFDRARANARAAGAPCTSTGHLLGGLVAVDGARAHTALQAASISEERLKAAFKHVDNPERGGNQGGKEAPADALGGDPEADPPEGHWLAKFAIDLTARAHRGELDPVIGRDDEIRRLMEVLCRRRKNNPVLIGEPGVGKTAIIEGFARRLAEGDVPDALRGRRLLSLDLGSMVAGAKLRGDFEGRLKNVLREVREAAGRIVLFIDEIHTLVSAGGSGSGGIDAASMLKPALARGELHAVGATTVREYRQTIDRDAALARRFQTITVEEPGFEETLSILRGIKGRYEVHHGTVISDAALVAAVKLSNRYVSDRFLPDKAIDLVDEAASRLRLKIDALPQEIDEVRRRIKRLEVERAGLQSESSGESQESVKAIDGEIETLQKRLDGQMQRWQEERDIIARIRGIKEEVERLEREEETATRGGDLTAAAEIRFGRLPEHRRTLAGLEGDLAVVQKDGAWLKEAIDGQDIAEVVASWTGIPVTRLSESESAKLLELEQRLSTKVIGQDEAVRAVSAVIRRSRSGIQDPGRPLGSFLFLGPTGVGKTHLVKAVTGLLFDDPTALVRLDMSEYMEKHAVSRLVGAPPGYVGYEEGGQLTEAVRRRPFTVILLDEVEKAHREVFDLLLQVLDEGRLTDSMGRTVSFHNTLIIMTSNLGSSAIVDAADQPEAVMREQVMEALHAFFRPELLNRIDEVVIFDRLDRESIRKIVKLEVGGLRKRLEERDLTLTLSEAAIDVLAKEGYDPAFGARPVRRALRKLVEDPLAVQLISGNYKDAAGVLVDVGDDAAELRFEAVAHTEDTSPA